MARVVSITPIQPRDCGGLRGFGMTISFTDPQEPPSSPANVDKAEASISSPSASATNPRPPVETYSPFNGKGADLWWRS